MTPIPLGLLKYNDNYKFYEQLYHQNHHIDFSTKNILCFSCHSTRTGEWANPQWDDRNNVINYSQSIWKNFVTFYDSLDNKTFRKTLLKSKFTLCVHGGGIDPCPRAFEAILCGSIPIIAHSSLDEIYNRFPVVFVDEWKPNCLNKEKLDIWFEKLRSFYENAEKRIKVLEMMSLDYWWKIISDLSYKNNIPINHNYVIYASYGKNKFIDVTDKIGNFIKGDMISIPKERNFNEYFGDPEKHVCKELIINCNNITYTIPEHGERFEYYFYS
jgi:hypothetical protein